MLLGMCFPIGVRLIEELSTKQSHQWAERSGDQPHSVSGKIEQGVSPTSSSGEITRGQSHSVSGDETPCRRLGVGVNGAFSVLASIVAVAISMWIGIDVNFWIAAAIYLALVLPLRVLGR